MVSDGGAASAAHPLEARLIAAAQDGIHLTIADVGGLDGILAAAPNLGASRMMPNLVRMLLHGWGEAPSNRHSALVSTTVNLLESATIDFVVMEVVDVLDAFRPLPAALDEICFTTFLAKAGRTAPDLSGLARAAALEGAFRWAVHSRRWQLRLLDFLLGLSATDDDDFVCRAAKLSGVAYSHWRERGLLSKLEEFSTVHAAASDACFELGMAYLADGLDAISEQVALSLLKDAQTWFHKSAEARECNPEAQLYLDCIEILTKWGANLSKNSFGQLRDRVRANTFELTGWLQDNSSPPWLGSRHTEAACWSMLAHTIAGLAEHLDEAAWWEPSAVVEQYVLATYTAGRSILRRAADGTVAMLLRPALTARLAREQGHAYLLKSWLERNTGHEWEDEARQLVDEVSCLVTSGKGQTNPTEAAAPGLRVAALVEQARLPDAVKTSIGAAIRNAFELHLSNLTKAEVDVVERCREAVMNHPDHRDNRHGQTLFDAVLLWTTRFVQNRIEVTQKDDPTVAYLFDRDDGSLPHEDELQADYFRWLSTNAAGTDLEPTNMGGGRGDIRVKSSGERLVIEVKRELVDASFDSLATLYLAQSTDYQNVSIRFGFMLVLDLVGPKVAGTPHLTSLFQTREIVRPDETVPRVITIVKVPARRMRPSDLTKEAKSVARARYRKSDHPKT